MEQEGLGGEGQSGRPKVRTLPFTPCPLYRAPQTFWWAYQRARAAGGKLVMRNDDLDYSRVKPEFVQGFVDDLRCEGCGECVSKLGGLGGWGRGGRAVMREGLEGFCLAPLHPAAPCIHTSTSLRSNRNNHATMLQQPCALTPLCPHCNAPAPTLQYANPALKTQQPFVHTSRPIHPHLS